MRYVRSIAAAALALALAAGFGCGSRDSITRGGEVASPAAAEEDEPAMTAFPDGDEVDRGDGPMDDDAHGDRHDHGEGDGEGAALLAAEMEAYARARPVFDKWCASCHTSDGSAAPRLRKKSIPHFSMDEYPFKGHHAHELGVIVRRVLGAGPKGRKATMPMGKPGAVKGEDLALILAWADAFDAAHAAGVGHHADHAGDHGGHDHHAH